MRLFGIALTVIALLVVAAAPAAAKSCRPPTYPGSGYFTSLSVKKTTCGKGSDVALAHHSCRTKGGLLGYCSKKVRGFKCKETRQSIPTETNSKVTCRDGSKRVVFTYQQNT